MLHTLQENIFSVLRYEDGDEIASQLRREGISNIQSLGSRMGDIPDGSFKTIHTILNTILPKNGSATATDRIRVRCIGALGLALEDVGECQKEMKNLRDWLFSIAVSPPNRLAFAVSQRAGFILDSDRIVQTQ